MGKLTYCLLQRNNRPCGSATSQQSSNHSNCCMPRCHLKQCLCPTSRSRNVQHKHAYCMFTTTASMGHALRRPPNQPPAAAQQRSPRVVAAHTPWAACSTSSSQSSRCLEGGCHLRSTVPRDIVNTTASCLTRSEGAASMHAHTKQLQCSCWCAVASCFTAAVAPTTQPVTHTHTPEQHYVGLWSVDGVVLPAAGLLDAKAPPLVLQGNKGRVLKGAAPHGRHSGLLRPNSSNSCSPPTAGGSWGGAGRSPGVGPRACGHE